MLKMDNSDNKRLVLIYCSDNTGCSHVRLRYYAEYFNSIEAGIKCMVSPVYIFDPNVLASCKAIIWQKPAGKQCLSILQRYKGLQSKFGYKLIYELDDLFFSSPFGDKSGVPDYNPSVLSRTPVMDADMESSLPMIMDLFDTIMCSTDYFRKVLMEKFNTSKVVTVKNTVPRFLWSMDRKAPVTEDIVKPVVLYSGSMCHYMNPMPARAPSPAEPNGFPGIEGKPGDWDLPVADWLKKMILEDRIAFVVMGEIPYIFNDVRHKIKFIPWTNSYNYPRRCWSIGADFQIAPLVHNEFNKCKSALRFYESSVSGIVMLGSVFTENQDSPYEEIHPSCKIRNDYTVEQIDRIFWDLCKKENYNKVLKWQYDNMDASGMLLESDESLNNFLKVCDRQIMRLETI